MDALIEYLETARTRRPGSSIKSPTLQILENSVTELQIGLICLLAD